MIQKPKLVVLLGPTSVGKTQLSLDLAEHFNGEIVSGDSMQVYRGMDIGTAKATTEERERVPHHLIDIVSPTEPFSAAHFQNIAIETIADINERGKLPFLVGGTGLYIESICYQFSHGAVTSDPGFRSEMEQFADEHGIIQLHNRLRQIDPESAERLHPNDTRRIIRALEIFHLSGEKMSDLLKKENKQSPYQLCLIGLTLERGMLYKRIEQRIDLMLEQGLVEEVRGLLEQGVSSEHTAMQALGYKEIVGYLQGKYSFEEAVTLLKRDTRRYAKRQLSWFRHMKDIHWFDLTDSSNLTVHRQAINDIITGKFSIHREYN